MTNIKDFMAAKNMTHSNLASQTGIPSQFLKLIILGRKNPNLTQAKKISEALNMPLDFVFNNHETSEYALARKHALENPLTIKLQDFEDGNNHKTTLSPIEQAALELIVKATYSQ